MSARTWAALACAFLCLPATHARAQETLYGKQPPRGSTYVRFVNALPTPVTIKANFQADTRLGTSTADRVQAYAVVEQAGERLLSVTVKDGAQEGSLEFKVKPDGYVTVALEPGPGGKIVVIPIVDQAEFNQTRARVSFYNVTPACPAASLVLNAGGAVVFQGVATGAVKSRTVNPVQALVRAICAEEPASSLMLQGLEVGSSYSIWLVQPSAKAELFLTSDILAPYKPKN